MLLALASLWNVLAGYAGLVSVGQQGLVGFGAYVFLHFSLSADKSLGQDWTQIDPVTGLGKNITLADSFPGWMFVGPLHPILLHLNRRCFWRLALCLHRLDRVPFEGAVFCHWHLGGCRAYSAHHRPAWLAGQGHGHGHPAGLCLSALAI